MMENNNWFYYKVLLRLQKAKNGNVESTGNKSL
jgi:hypothetical protein